MSRPPLTDEEKKLWAAETRNVKPRTKQPRILKEESDILQAVTSREVSAPQTSTLIRPCSLPQQPPASPQTSPLFAPLTSGNFAGVDAATVRRIKRGQMAVSRRVDLHGMTQAEALETLIQFISHACQQNKRLVLVITGKGKLSEGGGVLKNMLPKWLNLPELRPLILAFDTAHLQHGGSGAFYLLLKRKNGS